MTAIEIDDPSESRRAIGRAVLLSTAINSAMLVVAIVGAVVIYASVSDMAQPRVHGKLAEHAAVTSPARESPPYGIPIGSVLAFPADSTVLPTSQTVGPKRADYRLNLQFHEDARHLDRGSRLAG